MLRLGLLYFAICFLFACADSSGVEEKDTQNSLFESVRKVAEITDITGLIDEVKLKISDNCFSVIVNNAIYVFDKTGRLMDLWKLNSMILDAIILSNGELLVLLNSSLENERQVVRRYDKNKKLIWSKEAINALRILNKNGNKLFLVTKQFPGLTLNSVNIENGNIYETVPLANSGEFFVTGNNNMVFYSDSSGIKRWIVYNPMTKEKKNTANEVKGMVPIGFSEDMCLYTLTIWNDGYSMGVYDSLGKNRKIFGLDNIIGEGDSSVIVDGWDREPLLKYKTLYRFNLRNSKSSLIKLPLPEQKDSSYFNYVLDRSDDKISYSLIGISNKHQCELIEYSEKNEIQKIHKGSFIPSLKPGGIANWCFGKNGLVYIPVFGKNELIVYAVKLRLNKSN